MELIAGRLVRVLAAVAADPGLRVSQVDVLEPAEREQLLAGWNDTAADVPPETVPELFAAQAARVPDAVAVACGGELVSYAELAARAGRLAGYLQGLGVGPESVVGVYLPRGVDLIVALLAVLRAGGGVPAGGSGVSGGAGVVHAGRCRPGGGAGVLGHGRGAGRAGRRAAGRGAGAGAG